MHTCGVGGGEGIELYRDDGSGARAPASFVSCNGSVALCARASVDAALELLIYIFSLSLSLTRALLGYTQAIWCASLYSDVPSAVCACTYRRYLSDDYFYDLYCGRILVVLFLLLSVGNTVENVLKLA